MMLLSLLLWILWSPALITITAQNQNQNQNQNPNPNPRSLDSLLQDYAYRGFPLHPRTGIPYDAHPPSNLTGIQLSALRLRSGSLFTRGVVPSYKEFSIPKGLIEKPYVERLVLVYRNLANWSSFYYPLPGYTYLAPVLGILAYDASNLSATNLPELDLHASRDPILIKFPPLQKSPLSPAKCVWFDLHGLPQFSNLVSDTVCSTPQQGHFSIVAESTAPSPAPLPPPPTAAPPGPKGKGGATPASGGNKHKYRVWKIVGSVVGGFLLLILLGLLIFWVQKYKRRQRMQQMEKAAEVGEALQMTSVGNTRAPVAMGTRTQPVLENEAS